MLDPDTIRAANYIVNTTDREEVEARFPDEGFVHEFVNYLVEGLSKEIMADMHNAKAKQLRGEELTDTEEAVIHADLENVTRSMMSSLFKLGLAIGSTSETEDLTAGHEWVKENPWRDGSDTLSRLVNALGIDIDVQVISVDADGEATVVAGTSELTPEEEAEIRAEGKRIAREEFGQVDSRGVPEAVKRWGL